MKIIQIILLLILPTPIYASSEYTLTDVSEHSTTNDCWMIFENGVYDLTDYLELHTRYLDIASWCGKDMTEDFKSKDGEGIDHKTSSYYLLDTYYIGALVDETIAPTSDTANTVDNINTIDTTTTEQDSTKKSSTNPYNLLLPLLLSTLTYWISYFLVKNRVKFNSFWNTTLLLTLLVPAFGFGVFMILRYQFRDLYNIKFDFMYWHVELSIVMGVLAINHFIQRFKQYLVQLKK